MSSTTKQNPNASRAQYLSIVGATVFGMGIFALIPKSNAGRWKEVADSDNIWTEKRPSGSSVEYVNKR